MVQFRRRRRRRISRINIALNNNIVFLSSLVVVMYVCFACRTRFRRFSRHFSHAFFETGFRLYTTYPRADVVLYNRIIVDGCTVYSYKYFVILVCKLICAHITSSRVYLYIMMRTYVYTYLRTIRGEKSLVNFVFACPASNVLLLL